MSGSSSDNKTCRGRSNRRKRHFKAYLKITIALVPCYLKIQLEWEWLTLFLCAWGCFSFSPQMGSMQAHHAIYSHSVLLQFDSLSEVAVRTAVETFWKCSGGDLAWSHTSKEQPAAPGREGFYSVHGPNTCKLELKSTWPNSKWDAGLLRHIWGQAM